MGPWATVCQSPMAHPNSPWLFKIQRGIWSVIIPLPAVFLRIVLDQLGILCFNACTLRSLLGNHCIALWGGSLPFLPLLNFCPRLLIEVTKNYFQLKKLICHLHPGLSAFFFFKLFIEV